MLYSARLTTTKPTNLLVSFFVSFKTTVFGIGSLRIRNTIQLYSLEQQADTHNSHLRSFAPRRPGTRILKALTRQDQRF